MPAGRVLFLSTRFIRSREAACEQTLTHSPAHWWERQEEKQTRAARQRLAFTTTAIGSCEPDSRLKLPRAAHAVSKFITCTTLCFVGK